MFKRAQCPNCQERLPLFFGSAKYRVDRTADECIFRCPSCRQLQKAQKNDESQEYVRKVRPFYFPIFIFNLVISGLVSARVKIIMDLDNTVSMMIFIPVLFMALSIMMLLLGLLPSAHLMTLTRAEK